MGSGPGVCARCAGGYSARRCTPTSCGTCVASFEASHTPGIRAMQGRRVLGQRMPAQHILCQYKLAEPKHQPCPWPAPPHAHTHVHVTRMVPHSCTSTLLQLPACPAFPPLPAFPWSCALVHCRPGRPLWRSSLHAAPHLPTPNRRAIHALWALSFSPTSSLLNISFPPPLLPSAVGAKPLRGFLAGGCPAAAGACVGTACASCRLGGHGVGAARGGRGGGLAMASAQ